MDANALMQMKDLGAAAAVSLAAVGSALGSGCAGMAAIGAWKKCYVQNKAASFLLLSFVGAPMTQTIYGFILMNAIAGAMAKGSYLLGTGIFGGLALGMSAWFQGLAGAAGADAVGETGKGFANYMIVLGMIETIAIFVLIFLSGKVGAFSA